MVLVFNFGGQFAHLITRRVRDLGVKSELVSPDISISDLKRLNPEALIFSGSPASAYEKNSPKINPEVYNLKIPILGICYGMQLTAHQLKGKVTNHANKQFGKENLFIRSSELFKGLSSPQIVWFSHGDQVDKIPSGFKIVASTNSAKVAAIEDPKRKIYGIQFHAEVSHTKNGAKILSNFLFNIAKAKKDWNLETVTKGIIKDIKNQVQNDKVIMAISGGVDSLVAAVLIKKAIGKNLHLVFIDTGLLREYDTRDLDKVIKKVKFENFKTINASGDFLEALNGIIDPEEKRKAVAKEYFKVFEQEATKIKGAKFLGQGTIYPDRVESASTSKHADKIKSHHNLSVPKKLGLQIIEPLSEMYKDEVRKIGRFLSLPEEFLMRHPFPGPGLSIRVLGEVTSERIEILKKVDAIFIEELKNSSYYVKVSQAFAVLLPVKSVGVMGDGRTYANIISLRSVDTLDFMTADWSKLPNNILEKVSSRIVNEVRGVNRVVYDITQKPPATIEYE